MTILVYADFDASGLKDSTAKVLSAALKIASDIHVLVAGENTDNAANAAANLSGVSKVLVANSGAVDKGIAEDIEALITPLMSGYEAVLFSAGSVGKNAAPRIAAKLDVAIISDIIEVMDAKTFKRPIYAGNAIETIVSSDNKLVITVRPTSFDAAANGASASIETIAAPSSSVKVKFISEEMVKTDRPELQGAKRVVSGGRALGSEEEFNAVIVPLADKLGAAVGASRAAVDAGYAPNDYQVGQTGKVVAPELYVAVGISGAIQHLAGMKDSKTIVAINKDPDAPIFAVADYGLVADYKTAIPEIMSEL